MKKNKGQISVFLGLSLLVLVGLLGFVINVGLYVKARINLQNAVDAAAYSGAAVQARQLTLMGNLNYEIRNVMKEWMFKYYVVGQGANEKVRQNQPGAGVQEFRPKPLDLGGSPVTDKWNIPRTCINFGTGDNICNVAAAPGLPRFDTSGVPEIADLTEKFTNAAVEAKSVACSQRSLLNFTTLLNWTYGTRGVIIDGTPALLADRIGAWPKAIELAIRMRNLEMIINRPPINGICASAGDGCEEINNLLSQAGNTPMNERPIRAFFSAYKNLGGGSQNINNGLDHFSIKNTLKLTELSPKAFPFSNQTLSGLLIPQGRSHVDGSSYDRKFYLDLLVYPINYIVFFTSFISDDAGGQIATNLMSEGSCNGSITGIPVPGYIVGFVKNPKVVTYYAVKAEAKYFGLFYPFSKNDGITLRAYAAAKPFGGRIGPHLFKIEEDRTIKSRQQPARSSSYISGLGVLSAEFTSGDPIPYPSDDFYISNSEDVIGGVPGVNETAKFGVPNLVYDFTEEMDVHTSVNQKIHIIREKPSQTPDGLRKGLYDSTQLSKLIDGINLRSPSDTSLKAALFKSMRATKYDAANYLIPNREPIQRLERPPMITSNNSTSVGTTLVGNYKLFAPLCSTTGNYLLDCDNRDSLIKIMKQFLESNEKSITKYFDSLKEVADSMRDKSRTTSSGDAYVLAAKVVHEAGVSYQLGSPPDTNCPPDGNLSLARLFHTFFSTTETSPDKICGVKPILGGVSEALFRNQDPNFASFTFPIIGQAKASLNSAYRPGPRSGATQAGDLVHPFSQSIKGKSARNYYSTKLISVKNVLEQQSGYGEIFPYSEQFLGTLRTNVESDVIPNWSGMLNNLSIGDLREFGDFSTSF